MVFRLTLPLTPRTSPSLQHHRGRIVLQQLCPDAPGAFAELAAGCRHCTTCHHHRARAPGASRIGRHRGVAEDDANLRDVYSQHFMRDLGQRRLHALPVRMHADPQFEAAVRGEPCRGLLVPRHHRNAPAGIDRGAVRGLLAIDGDADADAAAVSLAPALFGANGIDVDRGERAAHRFRIVTAVEMLFGDVVERHLLRQHQIAQPHLAGLEPGLGRHEVEHQLQCKANTGARHAAVRQDRTFVGGDREGSAAIGRHLVGAGQDARDLRSLEARRERIGRVGAGIHRRLAIDAAQRAVAIGVDRDPVMMLAAIRAGDEVLAAILDPAHGMAAAHRQPGQTNLFGQQDALVTKTAADVGRDDTDLAFFHAETFGKTATGDVRHLGRRMQRELVGPAIEGRDHATAFERGHALPRGRDLARHLDRRVERGGDVDLVMGLEEDVVAPMLVHQGRAGLACLQHVRDSRQLFQLERHGGRDVLGLGAGRRNAHRDEPRRPGALFRSRAPAARIS